MARAVKSKHEGSERASRRTRERGRGGGLGEASEARFANGCVAHHDNRNVAVLEVGPQVVEYLNSGDTRELDIA